MPIVVAYSAPVSNRNIDTGVAVGAVAATVTESVAVLLWLHDGSRWRIVL